MKAFSVSLLTLCVLVFFTALAPASKADEWNKDTTITFNHPTEIPGQVLPAGTYVFKTLGRSLTENVVQIWNANQDQLIATEHVIPDHMAQPYDGPIFNIDHNGSNAKLDSWFYPGDENGFQFDYTYSGNVR